MRIDIETVTAEELKNLPYSSEDDVIGEEYKDIIIIPLDYYHDSGFRCMKYVLCNWIDGNYEVIAVVGGGSDALHLYSWANIDCLPCGYLRVMLYKKARVPAFIASDFMVR